MDIHINFNNPVGFLEGAAWVLGVFFGALYLARFVVKLSPPRSGDDRQGLAVGGFFFLFLAALAAIVTFVLLFIGHAGIAALAALGLAGFAVGLFSKA